MASAHAGRVPLQMLARPVSRRSDTALAVARYAGAASLLAVGAVHAQQYYGA